MDKEAILKMAEHLISRNSETLHYISEDDALNAIKCALNEYENNHGSINVEEVSDTVIDAYGRIFWQGFHVGWMRKGVGVQTLREFGAALNAQMPVLIDDFLTIKEEK